MDDGDLARLLRRTMDLLAQVYYQAYRFREPPVCCEFVVVFYVDMDFLVPEV
jgi:hypothetical protein